MKMVILRRNTGDFPHSLNIGCVEMKFRYFVGMFTFILLITTANGHPSFKAFEEKMKETLNVEIEKMNGRMNDYEKSQRSTNRWLTTKLDRMNNEIAVRLLEYNEELEYEVDRLKNKTTWLQGKQAHLEEKLERVFFDLSRIDNIIAALDNVDQNPLETDPSKDDSRKLKMPVFDNTIDDPPVDRATIAPNEIGLSQIYAIQNSQDKLSAQIKWMYEKLQHLGVI